MAWDEEKSNVIDPDNPESYEKISPDDWNDMVDDQKNHNHNGSYYTKSEVDNKVDKYEIFTLNGTDISNAYVDIAGTINDNQSFRVFIDNMGIKAEQGIDYSISGTQVFWSGYELQNLLEVGDKLKIFYI